jgi:hypothetical protein
MDTRKAAAASSIILYFALPVQVGAMSFLVPNHEDQPSETFRHQ